ncbi:hypothetical protein Adt_31870 [Abeliophyllum distichum]|uniref:Uncharacterized protein n=1 Tax=Abeliophyllum distichum TaxID=126358 RepID=A0ABD1RFC5_9LAMI
MEHSFAQGPLQLGLGHLGACSSQGALLRSRAFPIGTRLPTSLLRPRRAASFQLRSRASPTQTRPSNSLFRPKSTASFKGLSHWDSATYQLAPPREHSLAQGPLPLGLDHLTDCSAQGAQLYSRVSLTGTRSPSYLLCPRSTDSLKLAPSKEHSFIQGPLPLGLGHLAACSAQGEQLVQGPLPLGLGHLAACSAHGAHLRSSASPTGTRPPSSLLRLRSTASLKGLSH